MSSKFKSFPPKRPFKVTYYENDMAPPASATAAILGKALTGEVNEMIRVGIENKGALSAQNDTQQTVLHLLIDNDKLSPDELYHKVVAAVDAGAPVDTPDKDGVRPIHLAAKRQNLKVVEYLLNKGAEPNSQTSTKMTPLHFAVVPTSVSCEPRAKEDREKKERISAPPTRQIGKITDDVQNYVNEIMKGKIFVKYIKHLGLMATNNHFITSDKDDEKAVADIFQSILDTVKPGETPEAIRQRLQSEVRVLREQVYRRSLTAANNGIKPAEFRNDPDNAWGPVDYNPSKFDPDNRVLYNFKGLQDWYLSMAREVDKSLLDSIEKVLNRTTTMRVNMDAISKELDKIKNVFHLFNVMIDYEDLDTGDEMIKDSVPIRAGGPRLTGADVIARQRARKGLFNTTTFGIPPPPPPAGGPVVPYQLSRAFDLLTQYITLNNPDTSVRYDLTRANNHTVFQMSIINKQPIDLNVYPHQPHQNVIDYLDRPANAADRTMSDMVRHYINAYQGLIADIKYQTQYLKDNIEGMTPKQVTHTIGHIEMQLVTMAYGNYLLSTMFDLTKILKREMDNISRDGWKIYEQFVERIKTVFDEKEIAQQVKANITDNVKKLMRFENNRLVNDSEHVLLVRSGSGNVDQPYYTAPTHPPANRRQGEEKDYYLLYNKNTKKVKLVHLEYVHIGPARSQFYDRKQNAVVIRPSPNQLYYKTQKVPPGSPPGTAASNAFFFINEIDTPKLFDGDAIDIIQNAEDSLKKLTKSTYNLVVGAQNDLNEIINAYNKFQGINVLRTFHNDVENNMAISLNNTNNYQNVLDAPLPNTPDLPKDPEAIKQLIEDRIGNNIADNQPAGRQGLGYDYIHPLDLKSIGLDFVRRYFYRLKEGSAVNNINAPAAGIVPVAYVPGVVPDISQAPYNVYANINLSPAPGGGGGFVFDPDYPVAGVVGQINQNDDKETTDYPILREVMEYHLQAIKYQVIMYIMQILHRQIQHRDLRPDNKLLVDANFDRNYVRSRGRVPTAYTEYVKLLASIDNTRPEQISLMTIGKIADEIAVSTFRNVIATATNVYIHDIAFPNQPLGQEDTVFTRITFGRQRRDYDFGASLVTLDGDNVQEIKETVMADYLARYRQRDELSLLSREYRKFEKSPSEQISRMINPESAKDIDDLCYPLNIDVSVALTNPISVNSVDADGNTPLYYAGMLQNIDLISNLVSSGSVIDPSLYRAAQDRLVRSIKSSPMFNIQAIERKVASHMVQKFKINVIPDKSILILRMAMYLFDHQLTLIANRFPNRYGLDDHTKVLEMVGIGEYDNFDLPVTNMLQDSELIKKTSTGAQTLNESLELMRTRLSRMYDDMLSITNQIANMRMQAERYPVGYQERAQFDNMIRDLEGTANDLRDDINDLEKKKTDLEARINRPRATTAADNIKRRVKAYQVQHGDITNSRAFNVTNAYDRFFKDALNDGRIDETTLDYVTYFQMWSAYLSTLIEAQNAGLNPDSTQLVRATQSYLLKLGGEIENDTEYLKMLDPIAELYTKVFAKYGEDYFDMSMYLTDSYENYALKQIYNIMYHVFKHTISVDIINATAGLLARTISEGDEDRFRIEVTNIFRILTSSGFIRECMTNLPRKVIKTTCVMSEGENDLDIGMSVEDVMNSTLDMITLASYQSVAEGKIKKVKTDIVDYYAEYAKAYTAEMHDMMVRQLKSLMYQSRQLEIMKILNQGK